MSYLGECIKLFSIMVVTPVLTFIILTSLYFSQHAISAPFFIVPVAAFFGALPGCCFVPETIGRWQFVLGWVALCSVVAALPVLF